MIAFRLRPYDIPRLVPDNYLLSSSYMGARHLLFSRIHPVDLDSFRESGNQDIIAAVFQIRVRGSRRCNRKIQLIIARSAAVLSFHGSRKLRQGQNRGSARRRHRSRRLQAGAVIGPLLLQTINRKLKALASRQLLYIVASQDQRPPDPVIPIFLLIFLIPVFRPFPGTVRPFPYPSLLVIIGHSRRLRIYQEIRVPVLIGCRGCHQIILLIYDSRIGPVSARPHIRIRMQDILRRKQAVHRPFQRSVSLRVPIGRVAFRLFLI